jgi:hypothetical protein
MSYKYENKKHFEEFVSNSIRKACNDFRKLHPEVSNVKVETELGKVNIYTK